MDTRSQARTDLHGLLSIGGLARRVGISPDTLRIWERRYGQPVPVRLASGHRRYTADDVQRMRCVSELLARGQRPGELLVLSTSDLEALLEPDRAIQSDGPVGTWLGLCEAYRTRELAASLVREARRTDALEFLSGHVVPFLREAERRVAEGRLGERHARLGSLALRECLHTLRHTQKGPRRGRLVIAPHAEECEALTALMLAHLAESRGAEVCLLADVISLAEIGRCAVDFGAHAVVLATQLPHRGSELSRLRSSLPPAIGLALAGIGLRSTGRVSKGVQSLRDLCRFTDWLASLKEANREEVAIS